MDNRTQINLLVIDPFANEDYGHLLDDDLFWATHLANKVDKFGIRSSSASIAHILKVLKLSKTSMIDAKPLLGYKFQKLPERVRLILMALFIRTGGYSDILFQSFEEISTLIFILLRPNKRVHLIITNNLSLDRFEHRPIYIKILLKSVFHRAKTLFVHSQFEVDLLTKKLKTDPTKIKIKPFHQFAISWPKKSFAKDSGWILHIGAIRISRPIEPFLDLIRADYEKKNNYVIAGIADSDLHLLQDISSQDNVSIFSGFLSKHDYNKLISEAKLIILTHNHFSEGKLSGLFCDAVASGTPIVSAPIAPITDYFKNFGKLGILVDYKQNEWWKSILYEPWQLDLLQYQKTIDRIKEFSTADNIINLVLRAICRPN